MPDLTPSDEILAWFREEFEQTLRADPDHIEFVGDVSAAQNSGFLMNNLPLRAAEVRALWGVPEPPQDEGRDDLYGRFGT